MSWYRAYVDRAKTGEHSRVIDGEAESADQYAGKLELEKDEELNQVVELAYPDQADV